MRSGVARSRSLPAETHAAGAGRGQAEDRTDGRRLPHAVAAEQRRHLASLDGQVQSEQDLALTIGRVQPRHLQDRAHEARAGRVIASPRLPDKHA